MTSRSAAHLNGATLPKGPLLVAHEQDALAARPATDRVVAAATGCVRRLAACRAVRAIWHNHMCYWEPDLACKH